MTQQQLADLMARTGARIHRSTVGKIESGGRPVTIGEAVQFAGILGVPLAELVTEPSADTEVGRRHADRVQAQIRLRFLVHEWNERQEQLGEALELLDITEKKLGEAARRLRDLGGELPVVRAQFSDGRVISTSLMDELPTDLQHILRKEESE